MQHLNENHEREDAITRYRDAVSAITASFKNGIVSPRPKEIPSTRDMGQKIDHPKKGALRFSKSQAEDGVIYRFNERGDDMEVLTGIRQDGSCCIVPGGFVVEKELGAYGKTSIREAIEEALGGKGILALRDAMGAHLHGMDTHTFMKALENMEEEDFYEKLHSATDQAKYGSLLHAIKIIVESLWRSGTPIYMGRVDKDPRNDEKSAVYTYATAAPVSPQDAQVLEKHLATNDAEPGGVKDVRFRPYQELCVRGMYASHLRFLDLTALQAIEHLHNPPWCQKFLPADIEPKKIQNGLITTIIDRTCVE